MIAMLCIEMFYHNISLHFDINLSNVRFLTFNEWLYVSTLLSYCRMNDFKPEMEIQKYDLTTDLAPGGLKTQRE